MPNTNQPAFTPPGGGHNSGGLSGLFDAIDNAGKPPGNQRSATAGEPFPRRRAAGRSDGSHKALGWTIGAVVVVLLGITQFIYLSRSDLARYPQIRPLVELVCTLAGCEIPLLRAPDQLELISAQIREHPQDKTLLLAHATFANRAPFPQAYPILRLDLIDVNGIIIATRHFQPEEYLDDSFDIEAGIQPDQSVEVELEIADPDGTAFGFEMAFS